MERKHSVLCIPIRYIATNKEERPFLLEMKPEDTFSDIQSKILDCYRLPVARQLFYCGDKCLNATYTPETKLSEIKEMQNMSKAQAIFVYDINSMKQNVNTAISTTSPESAIGLMSPGTLSMNANNLLNNSKGGPLYIKCGKQPAHDPLNIEDHISVSIHSGFVQFINFLWILQTNKKTRNLRSNKSVINVEICAT